MTISSATLKSSRSEPPITEPEANQWEKKITVVPQVMLYQEQIKHRSHRSGKNQQDSAVWELLVIFSYVKHPPHKSSVAERGFYFNTEKSMTACVGTSSVQVPDLFLYQNFYHVSVFQL